MQEVNILINSVDLVTSFVNKIEKLEGDFDIRSGRYVIDAKSIMGVFSCDLTRPLKMIIHSDDKRIPKVLKEYIV